MTPKSHKPQSYIYKAMYNSKNKSKMSKSYSTAKTKEKVNLQIKFTLINN